MSSRPATPEDVALCYQIILKRKPESHDVIMSHLAGSPGVWDLVERFTNSLEMKVSVFKMENFIAVKLSQRNYLAKAFSEAINCACYFHHYSFLFESISVKSLDILMKSETVIFEQVAEDVKYTVKIGVSREFQNEGELSLSFYADDASLYIMSFTFIPGYAVGLPDRHAILISRMQGRPRRSTETRQARKVLSDVSPQAILYASLRGIAQATGVEHIAGVSTKNQVFYDTEKEELFQQTYDHFFASVDADGPINGFYVAGVSTPEKPLNLVKPGHRLRTKAKRKFKAEISEFVHRSWPRLFSQTADGLVEIGADPGGAVPERVTEDGLHDKLVRTVGALVDAQQLTIKRAQEIRDLHEQMSRTNGELADARLLASEHAQAIEEGQRTIEQLRDENDIGRRQSEAQRDRADRAETALAKIRASSSWRLTAPIRAIARGWRDGLRWIKNALRL